MTPPGLRAHTHTGMQSQAHEPHLPVVVDGGDADHVGACGHDEVLVQLLAERARHLPSRSDDRGYGWGKVPSPSRCRGWCGRASCRACKVKSRHATHLLDVAKVDEVAVVAPLCQIIHSFIPKREKGKGTDLN